MTKRPRILILALISIPALALGPRLAQAGRGGGGGRGGGMAGARGGGMAGARGGGMAGARGGMGMGGYRGGGMGGYRGGAGMGSYNRTPSFGTARPVGGAGGMRGPTTRTNPYAGRVDGGYRGGAAGSSVRYGGANANVSRSVTNNLNRAGVVGGAGGAAAVRTDGARGWHNPNYAGYHSNLVHGYWPGHYGGWGWGGGGWGLGGYGYGLGAGLAAWGLGSALYSGWGYMPYANPYYTPPPAAVAASGFDYSQPIMTNTAPPAADVTDPALAAFDQARGAFQAGDYQQALALSDPALKAMPDDATIHEFRAVTLFALGQYDDAAAALYSVLSVGPGWDWTTLISLYPSIDVYTAQLRALEQSIRANPNDAGPRFVLSCLYLTAGQNAEAADQLKAVTALEPDDKLSAQLLQSIAQSQPPANPTPEPIVSPPANPAPEPPGKLAGTWTASPDKNTTIALKIGDDGQFNWTVTTAGKSNQIAGQATVADGVLTLAQAENHGPPLVGSVTWRPDGRFQFQALGGGPGDPGLTFQPAS